MSLRVSVITAVYNRATTLRDALASVGGQTWPSVEHIVVDGASTDGSLEIIEEYRARLSTVVSEPDDGIYAALNKGILLATGDIVGFMHADDEFADAEVLSRVAAAFSDPAVEAVYGDLVYVSKSDTSRVVRYWRAGEFSRDRLARGWMPPHPTFYVRRQAYLQWGMFDTSYKIAADYEHMLRLLSRPGFKVSYIPRVLVRMRTGGASNVSLANLWRKSLEDYWALRSHGLGGMPAVVWKNVIKLPQFVLRAPPSALGG